MTDTEINIAIAECLGLRVIKPPFIPSSIDPAASVFTREAAKLWRQVYPVSVSIRLLNDYAGSLDAMHEAEKLLHGIVDTTGYLNELLEAVGYFAPQRHKAEAIFVLATATARQRAEAFLRVKGAWVE